MKTCFHFLDSGTAVFNYTTHVILIDSCFISPPVATLGITVQGAPNIRVAPELQCRGSRGARTMARTARHRVCPSHNESVFDHLAT